MKRSHSKLSLPKENDNQPKVSHYFANSYLNVSKKVSPCKNHEQKTPEKAILQNARCNSPPNKLLSPDMIPPTPPQPKRIKLEEKDKRMPSDSHNYTKLQPKAIIPSKPSENSPNSSESNDPTNFSSKEKTEDSLSKDAKIQFKKDFYHLGRHKVLECLDTESKHEKCILVLPEDDSIKVKRQCMLRDFWINTAIRIGDVVHIQADWNGIFDENGDDLELAIIDRNSGLIVVQPDILVSGTSVVASLFCHRKAVLSERFRGIEPTSRQMLSGTLVHRLLQKSLRDKCSDAKTMQRMVDTLLSDSSTLHDLYGSKLLKEELQGDVIKFIPMIQHFIAKYVQGGNVPLPKIDKGPAEPSKKYSKPSPMWDGRIQDIADIEENIWSPWLGIKGKVDLTVKVAVNGRTEGLRMPLELKTGRSTFSAEHKGQVTLYTMMMNQSKANVTKAVENPGGLLLYLRDGSIQQIPAGHNEQQGLIQLRNELVHYLTMPTSKDADGSYVEGPLPSRIDRIQMCQQCPFLTECTMYQMAEETRNSNSSTTGVVPDSLAHLSPSHQQYFLQWSLMLRLEYEENVLRKRNLSDIWCVDPRIRETSGTCLSHLQVQNCSASQFHTSELDEYSITLAPVDGSDFPRHLQFQHGDSVVLSTDTEVAIATGCLVRITASSVTVATDRNLSNQERTCQIIHLDKLEYQGGQSMLYSNLSRLMANNPQATKLRELVIDKRPPVFKAGLPRSVVEVGKKVLSKLNKLQQRAVLKALTCEDYCLINGLPGTGKTSLIVALIRLAVLLGHSVLLTSYTHSAVDNVLLKLSEHADVPFIRIGRQHRTHSSILPYNAEVKSQECSTVDDLERMYSVPVVAATCLSSNHPVMLRRRFDFCIVDEAAQAMQVAVLGPLTVASKFILVGDPRQLPPVVQSRAAKSLGMDESLFVRLSNATPDAIVPLQLQYRMCGPVNDLANKLTYSGDLQCGNDMVQNATLKAPSFAAAGRQFTGQRWLLSVIQPDLLQSVVFLDTTLLTASFRCSTVDKASKSPLNRCEGAVALLVVEALHVSGVESENIGIIAPYQSQVKFLKDLAVAYPKLEINTVDQYQGRDKEAIVYTCTKSDSAESLQQDVHTHGNSILHDLRRLTVAVTRAKHKLVIIGDSQTLRQYPPFAKLLDALETHQLIKLCDGSDGFNSRHIQAASPAFRA